MCLFKICLANRTISWWFFSLCVPLWIHTILILKSSREAFSRFSSLIHTSTIVCAHILKKSLYHLAYKLKQLQKINQLTPFASFLHTTLKNILTWLSLSPCLRAFDCQFVMFRVWTAENAARSKKDKCFPLKWTNTFRRVKIFKKLKRAKDKQFGKRWKCFTPLLKKDELNCLKFD